MMLYKTIFTHIQSYIHRHIAILKGKIDPKYFCFFVWVETLHPSQQFFSHFGAFSCVEPVLSNEDEVSCSRRQHRTPGEIRTCDQESGTLPAELTVLP